jgi:hypothetical protein
MINELNWVDLKLFATTRSVGMHFHVDQDHYVISCYDGPLSVYCRIPIDGNEEQTDFETNFKNNSNKKIEIKDVNNRPLQRLAVATEGWTFLVLGLSIKTSTIDGASIKDITNVNMNCVTYRMYDSNGVSTVDSSLCSKTEVDVVLPYDIEIIGGVLNQKERPVDSVYYNVVAVPDIPYNYGGTRALVQGVDLSFVSPNEGLEADGRVAKYLKYNASLHTNKFRITLFHPPGFKHDVLQIMEIYRL